jgi:hypothetical protein
MFVSHFVFPVFFAPLATSMISARSINGFTPCVRLAVFFAMFYSFIKTHSNFTYPSCLNGRDPAKPGPSRRPCPVLAHEMLFRLMKFAVG